MRALTKTEAVALIEVIWNLDGTQCRVSKGRYEVYLMGSEINQVEADVGGFCEDRSIDLDPDTITITADKIEGSDLDVVCVVIKTEESV